MAKRKISPEGRERIRAAVRARWARERAQKASGLAPAARTLGKRRRGRPVASASPSNLGGHSTDELITLRRRIDQELADRMVRDFAAR